MTKNATFMSLYSEREAAILRLEDLHYKIDEMDDNAPQMERRTLIRLYTKRVEDINAEIVELLAPPRPTIKQRVMNLGIGFKR